MLESLENVGSRLSGSFGCVFGLGGEVIHLLPEIPQSSSTLKRDVGHRDGYERQNERQDSHESSPFDVDVFGQSFRIIMPSMA